jgi:hypothetical protein
MQANDLFEDEMDMEDTVHEPPPKQARHERSPSLAERARKAVGAVASWFGLSPKK